MNTPNRPGKVKGAILPQEYDLDRLISATNIERKSLSWNISTPACNWKRVKCDEVGNVNSLSWNTLRISGVLQWKYIPHTVVRLDFFKCDLSGEIEFESLPQFLRFCNLGKNNFAGTLDVRKIPRKIEELYLNGNQLEGNVDMCNLPDSLLRFSLWENNFSGTLDLTRLPSRLRYLNLIDNAFTGTLDFSHLPPLLKQLRLSHNRFAGPIELDRGTELNKLELEGNHDLTGNLDVTLRTVVDATKTQISFT
mmetsp:Transcript_32214/g.44193  ORF Transcript_32214/g.44193 Transcript_32214/m.44193 type:complete len:251 (+) Transcript_32214:37-789(+)